MEVLTLRRCGSLQGKLAKRTELSEAKFSDTLAGKRIERLHDDMSNVER